VTPIGPFAITKPFLERVEETFPLRAVPFFERDLVEASDGRIQGSKVFMKVVEDVIANSSPLAFIQDAEEVRPQKTAKSGLSSTLVIALITSL
jgi:hypothetical protein